MSPGRRPAGVLLGATVIAGFLALLAAGVRADGRHDLVFPDRAARLADLRARFGEKATPGWWVGYAHDRIPDLATAYGRAACLGQLGADCLDMGLDVAAGMNLVLAYDEAAAWEGAPGRVEQLASLLPHLRKAGASLLADQALAGAQETAGALPPGLDRVRVLTYLAGQVHQMGEAQCAALLIGDARRAVTPLEGADRARGLSELAAAYAGTGDLEGARTALERLEALPADLLRDPALRALAADTLDEVVMAHLAAGDVAWAAVRSHRVEDPLRRGPLERAVALHLAKVGREAEGVAAGIGDSAASDPRWGVLVEAHAAAGRMLDAVRLRTRITDPVPRARAGLAIAEAWLRAGRPDTAGTTAVAAVVSSGVLERVPPDHRHSWIDRTASLLGRAGWLDAAADLLRRERDPFFVVPACVDIARSLRP